MLSLDQYIEEFSRALAREVDHQKEGGGHPYQIHDGRRLLYDQNSWIYMFTLDHEVSLPDGAPVRVEIGRQAKATGEVIGLDNFDLILSLDRDLGEEIPEANLYCEPWELLVALQIRLQEIRSRNVALATAVLTGTPIALRARRARTNKGNGAADPARFVLDNAVAFVWGPPGTGKTETLARITAELWLKGERVLDPFPQQRGCRRSGGKNIRKGRPLSGGQVGSLWFCATQVSREVPASHLILPCG